MTVPITRIEGIMERFPVTPGQRDILQGTYSSQFVDGNAMVFAVRAPRPLSTATIAAATRSMWRQHPVLRMVPERGDAGWLQRILDVDDWVAADHVVEVETTRDQLAASMDEEVQAFIGRFNVMRRPSWGTVHFAADGEHHIVFVVNHIVADIVAVSHFIRTFVTAATGRDDRPNPKDTYLTYLDALRERWAGEPSADAVWWEQRPWGHVPLLPGIVELPDAAAVAGPAVEVVDVVAQGELVNPRLTEAQVLRAVDASIRDVTGVNLTRIDAARVARDEHIERFASGWLSHALPMVTCADESEQGPELARRRATSWLTAFDAVRRRTDLSFEDHLRAQVFINFFGSFAPHRWSLDGFRMSPLQPTVTLPRRSSLTPIHLKVRRGDGVWLLAWTMSGRYQRSDVLAEIRSATTRRLTSA